MFFLHFKIHKLSLDLECFFCQRMPFLSLIAVVIDEHKGLNENGHINKTWLILICIILIIRVSGNVLGYCMFVW